MNSWHQVVTELRKADTLAIISHVMPDGDCIGSMLALGLALKSLDKKVIMLNNDPVPQYLRFLPGADRVKPASQLEYWPELLVCVDCSDPARFGEAMVGQLNGTKVINIDHHVSNTRFGSINYVDSSAPATGQIVAALIEELGVPWDKDLATLIYTAIVTDTGSFQYSNTNGNVHRWAAKLIDQGLDVASINQALYETRSCESIRLLGRALDSLRISEDGRVAWIVIPRKTLEEVGASDEHTEGIINFTRSIASVEVGILVRELSPGTVKVGFRSKQLVDVNRLAGVFGGGGHARASGCTIEGELTRVADEVVQKAREFVEDAYGRHS